MTLIEQLFGPPVDPSDWTPDARRMVLLRKVDEYIDVVTRNHTEWQRLTQSVVGTLGMGALTLAGWCDKDGAEKWRWLREQVEAMDNESLMALEFEQ